MTFETTGFPPEILREVCFPMSCTLALYYCWMHH
uniref:Uncharacterized protein n=1 Tax=Arundo donax TaxID=35708 RepID=A0A0A9FF82_ARUDO